MRDRSSRRRPPALMRAGRQAGKQSPSRQAGKPSPSRRQAGRPAPPGAVLVTGASSGIGAALALRYARPGATLLLWGRDAPRLEAVAARCRGRGARAGTRVLDLADGPAALAAAATDDDAHPVGLAILAAGAGDMRPAGALTEDPAAVLRLGAVNFATPAALATLLAGRMGARGGGTVALIGSAAAFFDLADAAAYAGSKSGLARFAGALRLAVAGARVAVVLVSPGFVDTPMSRRVRSPKPFLMDAERAARRIARAIDVRRPHLILPAPFAALIGAASVVPPPVLRAIMRRIRAEPAGDRAGTPPLFDGPRGSL